MRYAREIRSGALESNKVSRTAALAVAGLMAAVGLAFGATNSHNIWSLAPVITSCGILLLAIRHDLSLLHVKVMTSRRIAAAWLVSAAVVGALALSLDGVVAGAVVVGATLALLIAPSAGTSPPNRRKGGNFTLQAKLMTMARVSELHDQQTHGHCQRVAFASVQIGAYLGLTDDELYTVRWAALLHDVGKSTVPREILLKPSALTQEELDIVKGHCRAGADAVMATSAALGAIAEGIAAHHERWDGKGYPVGLARDAIPLVSRIIAVVDVFEALTSERPYRTAMSAELALDIIRAGAGTHFDPDIVAVFELLHANGHGMGASGGRLSDREVAGPDQPERRLFHIQDAGPTATLMVV